MPSPLKAFLCAGLLSASPVFAGIPAQLQEGDSKWMRVGDSWIVDTEDVERKGDQLRFWVERRPVGNEQMSTQYATAWIGKIRIRCGDFHAKLNPRVRVHYGYGIYGWEYAEGTQWEKMKPGDFGVILASNFCYLTNIPGYTPEPITYDWQRKITQTIKTTPAKKLRTNDCDRGGRSKSDCD